MSLFLPVDSQEKSQRSLTHVDNCPMYRTHQELPGSQCGPRSLLKQGREGSSGAHPFPASVCTGQNSSLKLQHLKLEGTPKVISICLITPSKNLKPEKDQGGSHTLNWESKNQGDAWIGWPRGPWRGRGVHGQSYVGHRLTLSPLPTAQADTLEACPPGPRGQVRFLYHREESSHQC